MNRNVSFSCSFLNYWTFFVEIIELRLFGTIAVRFSIGDLSRVCYINLRTNGLGKVTSLSLLLPVLGWKAGQICSGKQLRENLLYSWIENAMIAQVCITVGKLTDWLDTALLFLPCHDCFLHSFQWWNQVANPVIRLNSYARCNKEESSFTWKYLCKRYRKAISWWRQRDWYQDTRSGLILLQTIFFDFAENPKIDLRCSRYGSNIQYTDKQKIYKWCMMNSVEKNFLEWHSETTFLAEILQMIQYNYSTSCELKTWG